LRQALALAIGGGVSLLALAMASPGEGAAQRGLAARAPLAKAERAIGTFTPAVRDPRLAAELARRGRETSLATSFQFTPATAQVEATRPVRVAVRVPTNVGAPERARPIAPGTAATIETPAGTAITPSTYNLGVAVGWRQFAITGDVASTSGTPGGGSNSRARVGVEVRATPRLTGRVQIEAEKAEGVQRIVSDDRAVALDVGGSFSIARNVDLTGGVRYRVSRDRIEPLARDERRDSQAVYIGTALRF
jgi:hypothetical protein